MLQEAIDNGAAAGAPLRVMLRDHWTKTFSVNVNLNNLRDFILSEINSLNSATQLRYELINGNDRSLSRSYSGNDLIITATTSSSPVDNGYPVSQLSGSPGIVDYSDRQTGQPANRKTKPANSPVKATGGIDFRAMNMIIQPMGSFANLQFNLPKVANIQGFNVDEELAQFNRMVEGGLMPSDDRLSEIIAVCIQRKELAKYRPQLLKSLARLCDLQESEVVESGPGLREALVLVDVI